MLVQWYPGHMAKAKRLLEENLKLIDIVLEIVDARAPKATRNPDFDALFASKHRALILNKSDLADPHETKKWIAYYEAAGIMAMDCVAVSSAKRNRELELIELAAREKVDRLRERGIMKTVRVMVAGIPNVGKSTFINRIAGAARTQVGDRPGITKGKQWVKITPYLDLLDTPGLLWPKLEDEALAKHLAFLGSVRDDVLDVEELASQLLLLLMERSEKALVARYKAVEPGMDGAELLQSVAKSRGFVLSGGVLDTERAARIMLDEFRAGKIAKITLDRVE